jgi:ABC-type glycerol-3-phosphate transport system substrate-binding protein
LGDAAYGLAVDVYGLPQCSYYGPTNVSFIVPEGESAVTPDPIAILKNPPHPVIAQHFMEFVLSREGQLLWMLPKGQPGGATQCDINRMSVYPSLYTELGDTSPVKTDPFKLPPTIFKYKSFPPKLISALLGAWLIDTHTDSAAAWNALNAVSDPKQQAALQDEYSNPPFTEEELKSLPITDWSNPDPQILIKLIISWEGDAIKRYRHIIEEAQS